MLPSEIPLRQSVKCLQAALLQDHIFNAASRTLYNKAYVQVCMVCCCTPDLLKFSKVLHLKQGCKGNHELSSLDQVCMMQLSAIPVCIKVTCNQLRTDLTCLPVTCWFQQSIFISLAINPGLVKSFMAQPLGTSV